jgi:hypothetical protein
MDDGEMWLEPCENGDTSDVRQKIFTGNTVEEVEFAYANGMTGSAEVEITRIDKEEPEAVTVVYSPFQMATMGSVVVHLLVNEDVQTIDEDWVRITDRYFMKLFSSNTSKFVYFTDLAGNKGSTGIVIDWIEVPEQNYGYKGEVQTFVAPQD